VNIHPIIPIIRRTAFDDPEWLFELKWDGFRGIADTINGRMLSKNRNHLKRFDALLRELPSGCIFDGEIVVLDVNGRPKFNDLLFKRGEPGYIVFDVLHATGRERLGECAQCGQIRHRLRDPCPHAWLGLGALTSDDAVYPSAFVDGAGKVLDGASKYVLHFEKGEMPPSPSGVWSVSPYRENFYVRNSINRYGILSGMPLKYNADGSLDIYIQANSPGADKEANWLPCPPSLPFNLTIRVYQPAKALLDGTYKLPPVREVS